MRRPGSARGQRSGAAAAVLRGFGVPAVKSAALLSVSGRRRRAGRRVVLVRPGAGRALEVVRGAVADEVPHAGGARRSRRRSQRGCRGDQRDLAAGRGHRDRAGRVGGRQGDRAAGAGALLDQVVPAGRDAPVSAVTWPGGAGRGGVLHRPAGEVDRRRGRVAQLDEVVGERGAGVAATAVHLADHDVRRCGRCGGPGDGENADAEQDRCGERDDARRDWTHRPLLAGSGRRRHEPAGKRRWRAPPGWSPR